ncbi:MAG: 4Fe-4S binding protein, partial [Caldisphaeraceae archaeon]|nr:4Fe-4S binding protein [Caldisphaeraceae archaeon]
MSKKIFINYKRCIGCKACEVACEMVNGESRIKVFEFEDLFTVPFNCRHCENAPCLNVCPTGALYRDEEGAVVLNPLQCIGCLMCAVACPFGVPKLRVTLKIMDKCDLCASRRKDGLLPACVSACPTEALSYGEINDLIWEKEKKLVIKLKETGEEITGNVL